MVGYNTQTLEHMQDRNLCYLELQRKKTAMQGHTGGYIPGQGSSKLGM